MHSSLNMTIETLYNKADFEGVFKSNYSRMFYCALDFVEDAETARDIVGDVTYETWRRLDALTSSDPAFNLSGYMVNSVRNRALNFLRHKAVINAYAKETLALKESIAAESSELHEERIEQLWKIIDSFDERTRMIFQSCWFEGKSYKETAEEFGISVSLVHKLMSKSFSMLRERFGVKNSTSIVTILILYLLFH